jgi:hypothetical protein
MKMNTSLFAFLAFNNGAGWKMDADGKIETRDGNPIYVDSSGTEKVLAHDTVARLNAEAKTHREAKEAAEAKLATFRDLDPAKARDAIEKLAQIDQGQLIQAGKVDEVKAQITQQFTAQMGEKDKALSELQSKFDNMQISNVFANSEFVREGIAIPRDIFETYMRQNFKMEDGKIVAYHRDGNPVHSKEKIGELASPDEALRILTELHPQKDILMKANVGSGSGSNGGGGGRGGGRVVKRSEMEALSPVKQAEVAAKIRSGEMTLAD